MTEQLQQNTLEETILAKFEADEKFIDLMVDEIEKAFPDKIQAELFSRLAVKLYHNSNDIDELNVQGMYISAVVDALSKILIDDKKVISSEEMQAAVREAHDISIASIEEANKIISDKLGESQDGNSTVSEVMTV